MADFIKVDRLKQVLGSIQSLATKDVLIGVPDSADARQDDEKQPVNNATLAYIHENGSPINNIPARPFLVPGVKDAQDKIGGTMKKAAQAALNNNHGEMDAALNKAGQIGQSAVRSRITNGDFAPLKPSTIANRYRQRQTKSQRASEKAYAVSLGEGMSEADAQATAGIKPLINTGQLRNALTYVIRKK